MVYGVGLNDVPGLRDRDPRLYDLWHGMLRRCYSSALHLEESTYIGCTACNDWLRLSSFIEGIKSLPHYYDWRYQTKGCKWELDKDILGRGSKVYSPDTCMFVTREDNQRDCALRNPGNRAKAIEVVYNDGSIVAYPSSSSLATILGINTGKVSRWIRGITPIPSEYNIVNITFRR